MIAEHEVAVGRLRDYITIQHRGDEPAALGTRAEHQTNARQVFAWVRPMQQEVRNGVQVKDASTHEIAIRYDATMTSEDEILYGQYKLRVREFHHDQLERWTFIEAQRIRG